MKKTIEPIEVVIVMDGEEQVIALGIPDSSGVLRSISVSMEVPYLAHRTMDRLVPFEGTIELSND